MLGEGTGNLKDYKFWCFNGEPKFWTINDGNGHGQWMYFYDMNQNRLSYKRNDYNGDTSEDIHMPLSFELMKRYATHLSKNFKFVRVDFYEIDGCPFLGEMTFTPGAFIFKYNNPSDAIEIGNMLQLEDKEQYIVSMTSYPERIECAVQALESIINQDVNEEYKIVLTLAEPQFPGKQLPDSIKMLEETNKVEILWHPTDIRSHKKLMPVLKKYPNATVIITDDDVKRPEWWLQMFIDDHKKYPHDVIVGESAWRLDKTLIQTTANKIIPKGFTFHCIDEAHKILLTERPANGLGGVLYPKHAFNDERFFDEELFMRLTPNSDESWQYCFNVIEERTLRMCGRPVEWSKYSIKGSQRTALSKKNNAVEYTRLYKLFFSEFPEYKEKMLRRLNEYDKLNKLIVEKKKEETPTVICQLGGRLGNILFEIASASYYAKQHNMPIRYYFD